MKTRSCPATRLTSAALSRKLGCPARTLRDILHKTDVESRGGYELFAAVRAIINYYRERTSKFSQARLEVAHSRELAEAELAQINLAERKGMLMLTANHVRWCRELATLVRVTVADSDNLSLEQKKRLCGELAKIKITP
jgi:hypothetical protein